MTETEKVLTETEMPAPIDRAGCLPKAVAIDMDEPAAIGRFEKQPQTRAAGPNSCRKNQWSRPNDRQSLERIA
ncbi:MAG TPA: hypothetical protein VKN63_10230 [Afifellaceae bacterium]|nr:hypothetical protein [Afifellaceae bacterium]